jgi:hypothetical protein
LSLKNPMQFLSRMDYEKIKIALNTKE